MEHASRAASVEVVEPILTVEFHVDRRFAGAGGFPFPFPLPPYPIPSKRRSSSFSTRGVCPVCERKRSMSVRASTSVTLLISG